MIIDNNNFDFLLISQYKEVIEGHGSDLELLKISVYESSRRLKAFGLVCSREVIVFETEVPF